MKQKAVVKLVVEKGERQFEFIMPFGAPYGESYDAAWEVLQEIIKLSNEAAEKAKRDKITKKEEDKKEK